MSTSAVVERQRRRAAGILKLASGLAASGLGIAIPLLLVACGLFGPSRNAKQIFDRSVPAVVRVDVQLGLGSGFVIDPAGLIATNFHVIQSTPEAQVIFRDGKKYPVVRVWAVDEAADLAIVEISANDLPALTLGNSDGLGVGERVYAIGNPLGFEYSMSDGIVSGLREIKGVPSLQVSVPLSPGSSGGPILNEKGQVVGIARGVVPAAENLGFAATVNQLRALGAKAQKKQKIPFEEFASVQAERRRAAGERVREIPHHAVELLEDCSEQEVRNTFERIAGAIETGAPLYNKGDHEGCYKAYAEAALDLVDKLDPRCGTREALLDGLERVRAQQNPDDKAWALRDAFDGLIDVIGRKLASAQKPARSR